MNRIFNLQGEYDPILTEIAQGYKNQAFIGDELFPVVEVEKEFGKTPRFGLENLRIYDSIRAIKAQPKQTELEDFSFSEYRLEEHSLELPIDWRESEASKELVRLESYAARVVMDSLLLEREYKISQLAQNDSNYNAEHINPLDGTHEKWNDDDSNPLEQIRDAMDVVRRANIRRPNVLILGPGSYSALQEHPKVIEKIKYTNLGVVTEDLLGSLLGTKNEPLKVLVGSGVYADSTTNEFTDLWRNTAILAYVPQSKANQRTRYESSFGYTYQKSGFPIVNSSLDRNGLVKYVLGSIMYDVKILNPNAGFIFTETLSD